MTHAEKQCRMLYKNDYDFSPKVKHWLEKGRTLRVLIRLKLGKEGNTANAKQTAKRFVRNNTYTEIHKATTMDHV